MSIMLITLTIRIDKISFLKVGV